MIAMPNKQQCETCTEECAMSKMAHEAAVGRMYATKQFIALQKKIESGQIVEVVRCKDCIYTRKLYGRLVCKYGTCSGCILREDFFCANGTRKETRKDGDDDTKAD